MLISARSALERGRKVGHLDRLGTTPPSSSDLLRLLPASEVCSDRCYRCFPASIDQGCDGKNTSSRVWSLKLVREPSGLSQREDSRNSNEASSILERVLKLSGNVLDVLLSYLENLGDGDARQRAEISASSADN